MLLLMTILPLPLPLYLPNSLLRGQQGGNRLPFFCQNCTSKFVHYSQELEFGTIFKQCLKVRYSPYVNRGFVYISVSKI